MSIRFPAFPRFMAAVLVAGGALGSLALFSWNATHRTGFNFLPRMGSAEWILYPAPAQGKPHPRVELNTIFRCGFILEKSPAQATLQAAGFHRYTITINGKPLAAPLHRGRDWKQPDSYNVAELLVAGQNEIVATVLNTNGPPAFWCSLEADAVKLTTSKAWETSLAGASLRNAQLATEPRPAIPGGALYGNISFLDALKTRWLTLLTFSLLSIALYWLQKKYLPVLLERISRNGASQKTNVWIDALPLLGLAVLWLAVFAHNSAFLPVMFGFDAPGHMDYVRYLMEKKSLPLADEGFEMFQPPLYYVLCASLLKVLHLSVSQPEGIVALRMLGMTIGIEHFLVVWAGLRLLFPDERSKAQWGVVLAAFLPPMLYLSHYVTNEAFAAALVSSCICLTLYILKQEHLSWKLSFAIGLCLGAALLAKFTAVFAIPPILGALLWRWLEKRDVSLPHFTAKFLLISATCILVCGVHYGRTWLHFGTPLIGNWDAKTGFSYWQEDGYKTTASIFGFGRVLIQPWFSGMNSLGDGLYSTLWGDGLLGGAASIEYRPPWNYDLMAIGYWLALLPTLLVFVGGICALRRFLREPSPQWFMLLGLAFLATLALIHGCFLWPAGGTAKAFYALPALVPFCALGAWGFDAARRRFPGLRPVLVISLSVWALNTVASFLISPPSNELVKARVNSLREERRAPLALGACFEGVARCPGNAQVHSLLVDTLLRSGAHAEAATQAELLLRQEPRNSTAHFALMLTLAQEQRIAEAVDHGWKALESAPGDVEIYEQLTKLLLRQENYRDATRVAREGLGMDPFSADLHCYLGTTLMTFQQNDEAISQLEFASALKPGWVAPHGLLGQIFTAQNRLGEAAAHYSWAVKLDTKNPAPHVDLGKVLALQGKLKEATNHFCQALQIEPNNQQAALELSAVLAKNPDPQ